MLQHSLLAPSAAHRWMRCPASAALERRLPNQSSAYAAEGSVAHLIASNVLLDPDYVIPVGEVIEYDGHKILVTREMAEHVHDYVDLVNKYAEGGTLMVDQRVDFSLYVGMPGQSGTADAIIVKNRELIQIDFKYGAGVKVDAIDNEQLLLYGLGTYDVASLIDDIDTLCLVIHQPRMNHVSEFWLSTDDLMAFAKKANLAAARVETALDLDGVGQLDSTSQLFNPGEKQCRFCNAKAVCPALREDVMLHVGGAVTSPTKVEEFAQFVAIEPDAETSDNYLAVAMDKVAMVEDWCKAIRAEIERRLLHGKSVSGYKLVEGKLGNRAWRDAKLVESFMKADLLMAPDDMYDRSLISPTTAEKRLKKTNPADWTALQEHIHRAPGKPSVAPVTDPRPALADVTKVADALRSAATCEDGE